MKTPPWKLSPDELARQQAETAAQADAPIIASNGHPIDPKTGRFMKGAPGRPKGSRNKVTLAIENMMEGEAEAITRHCIDLAKRGDPTAMKIVMDRIAPVRKGRPIPKLEKRDGETSIEALLRAVLEGEIAPEEGKEVVGLIESAARVAATQILADMRQRQMDAIQKAADSGGVPGGVMLVPMLGGLDDWESAVLKQQHHLKLTVKE
ncbi:DUF5681 domain-containing protein [Pseudomonas aeruginosa]|uniref:DUF5681 domain-containing protein n=1 Tax=Pseudomonas aeruginosa TaxID=287 RepID=UPI000F84D7D2|nr:hypothetical protein [Pseudomonas aeruginosa]MBH3609329.1 hypothetical protein [Pseudomonas aeruginosa]MCS9824876.1 hypothetical protein [Pseudomonas aeruginosa]RTU76521.1 hypothetical protein DY982_13875 [Pseudomonas aeruginosa]WCV20026.1 hypothetical protein KKY51_02960 [Pseudomonas aeruginosa]HEJ5556975.1 hypothetical protein [Pseudomonas aeruginosa]